MSVVETINDNSHFYHWLQQSGSYKNNFSYDGAIAIFDWYDELSESLGSDQPVEFDPVAWCVEFTEYDSVEDAYKEYSEDIGESREAMLDYFQDNTTVIELDNGHVILGVF